jgi:hypothetical protein
MKQPPPDEKPGRVPPHRQPPTAIDQSRWPPDKRYAISSLFGVMGFTNLEFPIAKRARAAGFLRPTAAYLQVRDVFRLYRLAAPGDRAALQSYVDARDSLRMTLQDGGTLPLAGTVELISEWKDGRLVVYVALRDERYWGWHGRAGDYDSARLPCRHWSCTASTWPHAANSP